MKDQLLTTMIKLQTHYKQVGPDLRRTNGRQPSQTQGAEELNQAKTAKKYFRKYLVISLNIEEIILIVFRMWIESLVKVT